MKQEGIEQMTTDIESSDQPDSPQKMIVFSLGSLDHDIEDMQLQMIMFLSSRTLPDIIGRIFRFEPCEHGPYSPDVDAYLAELKACGLVRADMNALTVDGIKTYNTVTMEINETVKSAILESQEFVTDLSDDELLTFIYVKYPEFQPDSASWNVLSRKRIDTAISLVRKQSVSAGTAAQISGMCYPDFENLLRESKIRWKA